MENTYLFIIWNKALWCKDKILKDLESSFEIINEITINWNKNHYEDNMKALYGRKLGPVEDKILPCGKGPFSLIIVKDNNPTFEERKMFDGYETVNSKIYDKKELYRKWTAGSHRIHSTDTKEELEHDLVILFGNDYDNIIYLTNELKLDTKGVIGFDSKEDLLNCLKLFGNNTVIESNNELFIFSKCRYDIAEFIKCIQIYENIYSLKINNETIIINIFGELDGDIPNNSYDIIVNNKNIYESIINDKNSYIDYIKNKNNELFNYLFNQYKLDTTFIQENPNRIGHIEWHKKIRSEINLFIKKITNGS